MLGASGAQKGEGCEPCRLPWAPLLLVCLCVCTPKPEPPDPMQLLMEGGKLKILTRNAPTTYYQGREELEGIEYELAKSFAGSMGLEPEFIIKDTTSEILEAIAANEGHIAAAGLSRTPEREAWLHFGPSYQRVRQQVVCRRGQVRPRDIFDLIDRSLLVVAGSSYEERLNRLCLDVPELSWTVTDELEIEQILEMVWNQEVDCTVADSNIVAINRRYLPELLVAFPLGDWEQLSWAIAPDYVELLPSIDAWLADVDATWELDRLIERYYGYVEVFDYVDVKRFIRRIEQRLPQFEDDFRQASRRFGVPWTLLAAQAYQESHWDTNARSPTGVRGIMMLTQKTSSQLGVVDRLNPKESIMGGAKYLTKLYKRLPKSILEPDRMWIALAAYNVGYGHVMDARTLAVEEGLNPDLWQSLREMLPRLSKREYYKRVRYGYARGREPVRYVQRIRDFRDLLEQHLAQITEVEGG